MLTKLEDGDIQLATPVAWPVYSKDGRLLLSQGQSIHDQFMLNMFLTRGLYRGNAVNTPEPIEDQESEAGRSHQHQQEVVQQRDDAFAKKVNEQFASLSANNEQAGDVSVEENTEAMGFGDTSIDIDAFDSVDDGDNLFDQDNDSDSSSITSNSEIFNEYHHDGDKAIDEDLHEQIVKLMHQEFDGYVQGMLRSKMNNEMQKIIQTEVDRRVKGEVKKLKARNPYEALEGIRHKLSMLYTGIDERSRDSALGIIRLAANIQKLVHEDADAMIAAVHLCRVGSYTLKHAVDMAIICELVSKRIGINNKEKRQYIMAAALTCDIAMNELQKRLQTQSEPLSDAQKELVKKHPEQSVEILKESGVSEQIWLDTVLQHHERVDGNGYPAGLKEGAISIPAKILAIADRYTAMISGRSYRKALSGKDSLSQFMMDEVKNYDEKLTLVLIHELGVFPAGSFVKLNNGEIAVVVRRGDKSSMRTSMQPVVASFLSENGSYFKKLVRRDCSLQMYAIKETVTWDKYLPFDISLLWECR